MYFSVSGDVWIGLERKNDIYQWIDGTLLTYTAWDTTTGEPTKRENEDCIRIERNSLRMRDIWCDWTIAFLCEGKLFAFRKVIKTQL